MSDRRYFDILAVIPLELELKAFTDVFPELEDLCTDRFYRYAVKTGEPSISMIVVLQEDMGKGNAARAVASSAKEFDFGMVVCLGIAGGLSKDLLLGDVCYTGSVLDFYDNSKVTENAGKSETKLSVAHHKTERRITQAITLSRLVPGLKEGYEAWQKGRAEKAQQISPGPHLSRKGTDEYFGEPNTLTGAIACAAVTDSPTYNAKLLSSDRRLLAVETESGGIFEQAELDGLPCLTLRGISDYANPQKDDLENATKGDARRIAASNCMAFFAFQLKNPRFVDVVKAYRLSSTGKGGNPHLPFQDKANLITTTLEAIGAQVDERLRELSPEYRLQLKGYKLPLPRICLVENAAKITSQAVPTDIMTILEGGFRLIIDVPRTYPDQSLAWILADDLLAAEINGKQAIPIVIDGHSIKLPHRGIEYASDFDISSLKVDPSGQLVFLIQNTPLSSRTRRNFLIEEINKLDGSIVVCFIKGDIVLAQETDFISATGAVLYSVADISFRAISSFIEKNFQIESSECEVIALRLKKTFGQFKLPAHPTFFAGIPREVLAALVQANRRAELLQLAVDGFLTFLVAGDPADIALSRTTRSRFLRLLVRALRLEHKTFKRLDIVNLTRDFAEKGDFEIVADEFIDAFVDKGVLHFEGEYISFTLPFMESYLLALELRNDENAAERYFDLSSPEFDILTFDLYVELGVHTGMYNSITNEMKTICGKLSLGKTEKNILATGVINPAFLYKRNRLVGLQKRIEQAIIDVQEDSGNIEKKQKLLDVHDKVHSEASKETRSLGSGGTFKNAMIDSIEDASRVWAIGTMLLGAGSEHLNATQKRDLAARLVSMASLIAHHWSSAVAKVNFPQIKMALVEAPFIDQLVGDDASDEARSEIIGTVEMMVDALEFNVLSDPIRRLMNFLCEEAREKVLGVSVSKAEIKGEIEILLRSIWLLDIDPARGKPFIKKAAKNLPDAQFLRVNVAQHMITRAYWNQALAENKKALLSAANEILEVLGLNVGNRDLQKLVMEGPPDVDGF